MKFSTRLQLSTLMFFQFMIWGLWYVTAPNYLATLGFKGEDFGWTYSVGPIAGMISPFFVGMIADRFFATQRVLAAMHLLGGAIMFFATTLMKGGSTPGMINLALFGYMLTYFPTIALANTLAMKNMENPEKQFPGIRVLGTIGWIAAGLALTWLAWDKSINMFYFSAATSVALGLFSFGLPNTPPTTTGPISMKQILGLDALVMFKNRSYTTFMIASMLICIPLAFYFQITSRVVEMVGLPIGQTMSYGQMSEIFFMIVMPLFFVRLGVKWMLAFGMFAWVLRYSLFAMGAPDQIRWMIIAGIVLHGICYDFFFVTGQIYTDQIAPKAIRTQAQGLLVLFTLGLGMAIGAQLAGRIETKHTPAASVEFKAQVEAKSKEIAQLNDTLAKATEAEKPGLEARIKTLQDEAAEARKSELKALEWKPLWGKPAAFAGMVLVLFVLLFRATPTAAAAQKTAGEPAVKV